MAVMRRLLLAFAAALMALPAWAGELRLRPDPVAAGPMVTIGDVFDGAGAASATPIARAPGGGAPLRYDARALQQRLRLADLDWANREGVTQVVIGVRQTPSAPAGGASGTFGLGLDYPVLARPLAAGETITLSDLTFEAIPYDRAPRDAVAEPGDLLGRVARRPLPAGQALRMSDIRQPLAFKRGEMVLLTYQAGGVRIVARGRALADAGLGEPARLVNLQSNRPVEAIATGVGEARAIAVGSTLPFRSAQR
jgi:flagella basal body P-ring formation protein FlgA